MLQAVELRLSGTEWSLDALNIATVGSSALLLPAG
jgi:hypothetical protein